MSGNGQPAKKNAQQILDALADEITDQFRGGERPRLHDYLRRYPQFATELERIFIAIATLHASCTDDPEAATNGEDSQ